MTSRLIFIAIVVAALSSFTGCDGRRLISDQAMMDHFHAHKQEFNELTQTYLHRDQGSLAWASRSDVIEIKAKTGIGRIINGPGYWFENPYSLDSARKLKKMDDKKSWEQNQSKKTAIIKMADSRIYWANYFWNGGLNWKDYVYFPEDPIIEEGRIKWPREMKERIISDLWLRVIDSLDSPTWERGECVLRKIEPRWFLRRCRAN